MIRIGYYTNWGGSKPLPIRIVSTNAETITIAPLNAPDNRCRIVPVNEVFLPSQELCEVVGGER